MKPVLVVENDSQLRKFLKRVIARHGYSVREAEDGAEALSAVRELDGQYSVVVSSLHMPHLNGASLCRSVKREYPTLPIVVISGGANPDDCEFGDAFLAKPFDPDTLMAAIARLCQPQSHLMSHGMGSL